MAEYTPGTPLPWQCRDDYTTEGFVTIIGNVDGEYVDGQAQCTYDVVCRCEDEFGERLPNVGQNVRYIAHACNLYPELLEALQWIAANYENGHMNHVQFRVEAKHRADAAIAKATDGEG